MSSSDSKAEAPQQTAKRVRVLIKIGRLNEALTCVLRSLSSLSQEDLLSAFLDVLAAMMQKWPVLAGVEPELKQAPKDFPPAALSKHPLFGELIAFLTREIVSMKKKPEFISALLPLMMSVYEVEERDRVIAKFLSAGGLNALLVLVCSPLLYDLIRYPHVQQSIYRSLLPVMESRGGKKRFLAAVDEWNVVELHCATFIHCLKRNEAKTPASESNLWDRFGEHAFRPNVPLPQRVFEVLSYWFSYEKQMWVSFFSFMLHAATASDSKHVPALIDMLFRAQQGQLMQEILTVFEQFEPADEDEHISKGVYGSLFSLIGDHIKEPAFAERLLRLLFDKLLKTNSLKMLWTCLTVLKGYNPRSFSKNTKDDDNDDDNGEDEVKSDAPSPPIQQAFMKRWATADLPLPALSKQASTQQRTAYAKLCIRLAERRTPNRISATDLLAALCFHRDPEIRHLAFILTMSLSKYPCNRHELATVDFGVAPGRTVFEGKGSESPDVCMRFHISYREQQFWIASALASLRGWRDPPQRQPATFFADVQHRDCSCKVPNDIESVKWMEDWPSEETETRQAVPLERVDRRVFEVKKEEEKGPPPLC